MNQVQILGRITTNPELRATSNGTSVTSFNVAVNGIKDSNGNQRTDFIPVVVWNKQAENVCKYVNKGDQLAITGRIQTSTYEAQDGSKRTKIEVLANGVTFLGTKHEETKDEVQEEDVLADFSNDIELVEDDDLPF